MVVMAATPEARVSSVVAATEKVVGLPTPSLCTIPVR
jgi:hypothetical protein